MKTIIRILIILAVAAVVVGLTLAIVNSSGTSAPQLGEGRQFPGSADPGARPLGFDFGQGEGQPRGEGGVGAGAFSMMETVKNIVVIVLIVAVIAALEWSLKTMHRKHSAHVLVSAGLPDRKE